MVSFPDPKNLYNSIKLIIEKSKAEIARNVNLAMVLTYYQIGKITVEDE
jgi:hypothetical protein